MRHRHPKYHFNFIPLAFIFTLLVFGGAWYADAQLGGGNPAGSGVPTGNGAKVVFMGGMNAVTSQVAAETFHPISGVSIASIVAATEGDAMTVATGAMICKNLKCNTTSIAGVLTAAGGTSWTAVLDDNGVATALTCTETTALTNCADTTHSVTVAAGDLLDFGWTPVGTPTAIVPHCSMDCYYQY